MAMDNRLILTQTDKKKLEDELYDLRVNKRAEVAQEIAEARGHGDLSENAEYDAAKDKEAQVNGRINDLRGRHPDLSGRGQHRLPRKGVRHGVR